MRIHLFLIESYIYLARLYEYCVCVCVVYTTHYTHMRKRSCFIICECKIISFLFCLMCYYITWNLCRPEQKRRRYILGTQGDFCVSVDDRSVECLYTFGQAFRFADNINPFDDNEYHKSSHLIPYRMVNVRTRDID